MFLMKLSNIYSNHLETHNDIQYMHVQRNSMTLRHIQCMNELMSYNDVFKNEIWAIATLSFSQFTTGPIRTKD